MYVYTHTSIIYNIRTWFLCDSNCSHARDRNNEISVSLNFSSTNCNRRYDILRVCTATARTAPGVYFPAFTLFPCRLKLLNIYSIKDNIVFKIVYSISFEPRQSKNSKQITVIKIRIDNLFLIQLCGNWYSDLPCADTDKIKLIPSLR